MTLAEFAGLSIVYFIALILILTLTYREFRRVRFNFNIFFFTLFINILLWFPINGNTCFSIRC